MKKKKFDYLKKLKEKQEVTDKIYNKLYPPGLSPRILYGLSIIQNTIVYDVSPIFCPMLSAIDTLIYNFAKIFVPLLEPLPNNYHFIKPKIHFRFGKNFKTLIQV